MLPGYFFTVTIEGHQEKDHRAGNIKIQDIDMSTATTTRARASIDEKDLGWGTIHLYRDTHETVGLYGEPSRKQKHGKAGQESRETSDQANVRGEICTILCILAVPSYLTPSDFLGWVGEKTRDDVLHFKMIRTERTNRYMVLMKFKNGRRARQWRGDWNGRVFNDIEPETAHVVFVGSVSISGFGDNESYTNDPFMPIYSTDEPQTTTTPSNKSALKPKPAPPPTPALIELPACPVCLERMDESTGLLTIVCQHVFHCTCLQRWKGSGCPVCRYTQDGQTKAALSKTNGFSSEPGSEGGLNECHICRSDANLWICLICGHVGCGRYDAAHAFMHFQNSRHAFAMDLNTQRVWDYINDNYVHRIAQDTTDGRLVSLPSATAHAGPMAMTGSIPANLDVGDSSGMKSPDAQGDYIPRSKLDSIGLEYTHLLASQLESQRVYFESQITLAADKAAKASAAATSAAENSSSAMMQLNKLKALNESLTSKIIPSLEREREKLNRRADRFETMARNLEKQWREEKALADGMREKTKVLEGEVAGLKAKCTDMEEENRDLKFFIEAREKIGGMDEEAKEELREGQVGVVEKKTTSRNRKRGKGGGNAAQPAAAASKENGEGSAAESTAK